MRTSPPLPLHLLRRRNLGQLRPRGPKRAQRPSLVHPRRASAGTPRQAVPVDLHLRSRPPGHDDAFALVLPEAKAVTMDLFGARFAETLPAGVHAVLMLDQAG